MEAETIARDAVALAADTELIDLRGNTLLALGEVLRLAGSAEARADYASALRLLDEIKAEEGSQNVFSRTDLGPMREACARWSKAT